ncbi:MAG: DUF4065 domain-containing protein [Candidatus Poribacteria bacterium]|nr:DUF4065 domain-containing protein [Candidatus Poribacteria bacterium]
MSNVFDVASYILHCNGEMTTLKLQKLVYYCQAWSLVWDEEPLFDEEIQAWANGPVVPALFYEHQGHFKIKNLEKGKPLNLTEEQKLTVDRVLDHYGHNPASWLVSLSHSEAPWKKSWYDVPLSERGRATITLDSMANYFSSLLQTDAQAWIDTAEILAQPTDEDIVPWHEIKKEFDIRTS